MKQWLSTVRNCLCGSKPTDYSIGAGLFCRGIGLIYLIALVSWWLQAEILIGKDGLVPIQPLLDVLDKRWSESGTSRWQLPNHFWITGASDWAIHASFIGSVVLAVFVCLGLFQGPSLLGVWIVYLSFVNTGDTFMSFQWDILLLEAGFLAIFVSSWQRWESFRSPARVTLRRRIAIWLVWLLIAKLMFLSGWVKLAWASEQFPEWWPDHTAMLYHYQTQPIPTWTAWYAHQLPEWFHKFSIWPMYFIELLLPFFVLAGNRLRAVAGLGFIFLMVLILLTGNYTYFNWLTIVICLPLIADKFFPRKWFVRAANNKLPTNTWKNWVPLGISAPVFILLVVLNISVIFSTLNKSSNQSSIIRKLAPFHICSSYGLFRTMTTERPEIILEGSIDGKQWKSYDFKWKPDHPNDKPRFVAPHQPRVAWQLWFVALEKRFHPQSRNSRWFQALLVKLVQGDSVVLPLFEENPFPDQPPKFLRARLEQFEFTNANEKKETGHWWVSSEVGEYLPEIRVNR